MRIAAYNVENLFRRIKAFNDDAPETHRALLDAHAEINKLFELAVYSAADKARMLELMATLGVLRADEGEFVWLRKIRGKLVHRPRDGNPFIEADGRADWVGWVELKTAPVDELAIKHTAMAIAAAAPDILALVEVENRPTLLEFHEYLYLPVLVPVAAAPFASLMLIDGNDDRGIDVGLALRPGYRIAGMLSHVDDRMADGELLFSRDCPEYLIETPSGARIAVLPNHFKSKFGGNDARGRAKRAAQAGAVAAIYRRLRDAGVDNVVVLGDLNDTPDSDELARTAAAHRPARRIGASEVHRVPVQGQHRRPGHRHLRHRRGQPQDRLHPAVAGAVGPGGAGRTGAPRGVFRQQALGRVRDAEAAASRRVGPSPDLGRHRPLSRQAMRARAATARIAVAISCTAVSVNERITRSSKPSIASDDQAHHVAQLGAGRGAGRERRGVRDRWERGGRARRRRRPRSASSAVQPSDWSVTARVFGQPRPRARRSRAGRAAATGRGRPRSGPSRRRARARGPARAGRRRAPRPARRRRPRNGAIDSSGASAARRE